VLTNVAIVLTLAGIAAFLLYRFIATPYGRLSLRSAITARTYSVLSLFIDDAAPITPQRRARAHGHMIKAQGRLADIAQTRDQTITGPESDLALRLYWPVRQDALPVLLFFHGGGFAYGNLDSHDNLCRKLAIHSKHLVVAVDYRLAPENPFPAALEDAYAALLWVADSISACGGNPQQLSVAGESAGGNLAAAVAMMARDRQGPVINHQVLLYPMLDAGPFDKGSYRDMATGFMITTQSLVTFWQAYAGALGNWQDPYFSPACAGDLSNLPAALVITAAFDPLRDGGELYARKLGEAGVPVITHRAPGVLHGFMMSPGQKPGSQADHAFALVRAQLQLSPE